jgi:hypothetical protein
LWLNGFERLAAARPDIAMTRLPTDHGLVFTHAREIVSAVAAAHGRSSTRPR